MPYLIPLFGLAAFLYSSVGHGGASAYLALLIWSDLSRGQIVSLALSLNVLVAGLSFWNYRRAGHFSARTLLPFLVGSVPMAFVGGSLGLSAEAFALVLGGSLLLASARLLLLTKPISPKLTLSNPMMWVLGPGVGAVLGFLAGLVGVGGGIFLSPLLLLFHWADAKRTAAVSSGFIVVNSLSGLAARLPRELPDLIWLLPSAAVVLAGGALGSRLGAARLSPIALQRLLALVLLVAAAKLLLPVLTP